MIIRYMSDLHIEFGFNAQIPKGDILILAGDIINYKLHGLDKFHPHITQNVFINNTYGILFKHTQKTNNKKLPSIEFNDFAGNKTDLYLENFPSGVSLKVTSNYFKNSKTKGPIIKEQNLSNPQFIREN